jgi:hypothetical protein
MHAPRSLFALLPLTLALFACEASSSAPRPDPAVQPAATAKTESVEKKSYGEPLNPSTEKVALADLMKAPSKFSEKTIRTEGTVTSVCQAKGCWLEIGEPGGAAHVKLGGHKFFVPKSANGKQAVVEGRVLPAVDKGHCEQEAEEQTGQVAKVELVATGVELF